jgi:predicted phosphodiesterase
MKLNILSDLHLGQGSLPFPRNDADAVVLAGDIARPAEAIAWAAGLGKPVLYVPGNHEFYGGSIAGTVAQLKQLCRGTGVRVLDDEETFIGDVRFLGSTLWTDFLLFGEQGRATVFEQALRFMRDFSRIHADHDEERLFTPPDAAALFQRHAAWLARHLAQPYAGTTVVITHHAPSTQSIHPRYEGSPINACFVSDAAHLAGDDRVQLWIHGHTHDSFDYRLNGTRVVCNPRGYSRNGVNENPAFDPNFIVEVG